MRKVLLLFFLAWILFFLACFAAGFEEEEEAPKKREVSRLEAYRIGYTDGYEKGKRDGFVEGYRKALEDFRRIYRRKLQEYKEIEAGKILVEKWRVSYPRVYQIPTEGGTKVVVEGCRVIKPIDDLLRYVPFREGPSLSGRERLRVELEKPRIMAKALVKAFYEEEIRKTGAVYFRQEGSDWLVVYFPDEFAKKDFCMRYRGACR